MTSALFELSLQTHRLTGPVVAVVVVPVREGREEVAAVRVVVAVLLT